MIKQLIKKIKSDIEKENIRRYYEVRFEWIKFFETRQANLKTVELPPFVLADQQMAIIKAANQVNFYYKKIMNYRKKAA